MATFTRSATVQATPSKVFAALTDLDQASRYMPDVVKIERLGDGPFDVGTRWKETRRIKLFGLVPVKAATTIEVTAFDKNKLYATAYETEKDWASYTFTISPGGTGRSRVEMTGDFKAVGPAAGDEKRAARMARWCEKADGDLLERFKASFE